VLSKVAAATADFKDLGPIPEDIQDELVHRCGEFKDRRSNYSVVYPRFNGSVRACIVK
jgi:hypothetical protein